jgi:hypothetical protein
MAEAQMGADGKDPGSYHHPIDSTGGSPADLPLEYANGLHLHADSAHLDDVATELRNVLTYIHDDLADAAKAVTAATTAVPHGKAANPAGPTPTGQFSDATHVWTAAGEQAQQLHSLTHQLATTISELADGTTTIADRYRSVERRNRLSAQQIEKLLGITAGSADPGSSHADSAGTSSGYVPSGS